MRNGSKGDSYLMALLTLLNVPPIRVPSSRAPPMMAFAAATRAGHTAGGVALRSRMSRRTAEMSSHRRAILQGGNTDCVAAESGRPATVTCQARLSTNS
jgi:hypothetical protein